METTTDTRPTVLSPVVFNKALRDGTITAADVLYHSEYSGGWAYVLAPKGTFPRERNGSGKELNEYEATATIQHEILWGRIPGDLEAWRPYVDTAYLVAYVERQRQLRNGTDAMTAVHDAYS